MAFYPYKNFTQKKREAMLNYKVMLHKPKLFARIFGLKLDKFLVLVERIMVLWDQKELLRLNNKKRMRAVGGGRKYKLERIEEKVLLILIFYRHNVTHEMLGAIFGLDASNVTRLINKMLPIFEQAADPLLKTYLQQAKEYSEKVSTPVEFFSKYPDLKTLIVDATEQRQNRPKDEVKRKNAYSGKKKIFANKTQIIVNKKTRILDVSNNYPGSVHDKKIFDLEKTVEKIPSQSILLGDLGYLGVPKEHSSRKVLLPNKKAKGQKELPTEQRRFNKEHSGKRIVVEHAIGKMKIFRVCSGVYRGKEEKYNQTIRNIAALVNLNYCST